MINVGGKNVNRQVSELKADTTTNLSLKANQTDLNTANENIATHTIQIASNTTAITNIGNSSPKGTYATLVALQTAFPTGATGVYVVVADGKWYFWNGSTWTVGGTYQSAGVAVGSINESKTSFFQAIGKNLFDLYTVNTGYYADWVAGGLIANAGYNASDYIAVNASTAYIANYRTRSVVYYDSNKTFLSAIQNATEAQPFTTPATCAFIRVSIYVADNNIPLLQIEKGNHITKYESHYLLNAPFPKNNVDGNSLKDGSVGEGQTSFFKVSSKNLLNITTLRLNSYLSPTTGNFPLPSDGNSYTYYVSDYISVTASTVYVCNKAIRSIVYFDSSKNFVSGVNVVTSAGTSFTTPSGVAYLRINVAMTEDMTTAQLEQNTSNTTFESHFQFSGFIPPKFITADKLADGILGAVNSKWNGKTFVSLGDSITWQDGQLYTQGPQNGLVAKGYQTILKQNLGFTAYNNQGVSGRPMADGTANGVGTVTTGLALSYSSYNLVIIAAGTNDFKLNVPLGTLGITGDTTFDRNTFYGAYRKLIEYILTDKPTIRIVLFTPLQRENGGYDVNYTNSAGVKLIDIVNATKSVGAMYGIPVCDMYSNSGITKLTLSTFLMDGLHPHDTGYVRMGDYASGFINAI